MENLQYRNAFCAFLSICVGSVALVSVISWYSGSFFNYSLPKFEFSLSVDELQRSFYTSDGNRAVDSGGFSGYHLPDQSRNRTVIKKFKELSRERELERELARARASILSGRSAPNVSFISSINQTDIPVREVYHNSAAFYRSYLEMERRFKVYVYEEGDQPMVHDGPCKDVYSIEGRFILEIEHGATRFRTRDPRAAHVYFMPFSVTWMVRYMYKPQTYDVTPLKQFVSDYVRVISTKYPFWNRSSGADHFMLACHDWGPHASQGNSQLFNNSIRVLCNANTSEGFNPQKDATLPEIPLYGGEVSPKLLSSKPLDSPRPYLAFFAGGLHGPIRPILLKHWKNRDTDMPIYEYLPENLDYYNFMLQSKFCLCPSGYEVASPRVIEAIYAECVPVILSEHFVLPFSDVLRWEAFSLQVDVSNIPNLKQILMAVSEEKYTRLRHNLRFARRHFELNQPPKRFDAFHMILHSVWLRRINLGLR